MASGTDSGSGIARVYADAMLALAESQGDTDVVLAELEDFAGRVAADAGVRDFLASPVVATDARRQALERLFRGRYSDIFVDSLQVLNRKGRLELLPQIARTYRRLRDEARNRVEVHVATASPLDDDLRERIRRGAAEYTGKEPELIETIRETLLGGLVVRIGDEKFDGSVASQLKRFGTALHDRGSRETFGGRSYWSGSAAPGQ